MSEFSDQLKNQLEQAGEAFEQILTASRGLAVKAREQGNKTFQEWVALGEAQLEAEANGEEPLINQIGQSIKGQLEDLNHSAEQIKVASLGLVLKAKEQSNKVFSELVEAGNGDNKPKPVAKTQAKRRTRKTTTNTKTSETAAKTTAKKPKKAASAQKSNAKNDAVA